MINNYAITTTIFHKRIYVVPGTTCALYLSMPPKSNTTPTDFANMGMKLTLVTTHIYTFHSAMFKRFHSILNLYFIALILVINF
mmetsp:Transcript_16560/g.40789  ORF Transcript_16560/g.40789 Transcript_16560/m.40789 type:complete len:84 (+) Transcript_16560:60-311(+)